MNKLLAGVTFLNDENALLPVFVQDAISYWHEWIWMEAWEDNTNEHRFE